MVSGSGPVGRPWWIDDAELGVVADPLVGEQAADVVVIGGGFTGLWTALALREREPSLDVALVEADFCGSGPSGRNGGFMHGYWSALSSALPLFGSERTVELARAAERIVPAVREFLAARSADAWLHVGGLLEVSAAPVQDAAITRGAELARELGAPEEAVLLDPGEVAKRCKSPVFRSGVLYRDCATVHPALLVRALRDAAIDAGIRLYEQSPVVRREAPPEWRSARPPAGGTSTIHTANGSIRADSVVMA